jgi:hypothetical protein
MEGGRPPAARQAGQAPYFLFDLDWTDKAAAPRR